MLRLLLLLLLFLATACAHGTPRGGGADASEITWNNPGDVPRAAGSPASGSPGASAPPVAAETRPRAAPSAAPSGSQAERPGAAPPRSTHDRLRERLVGAARRHVGRSFPGDCSGFVLRVFAEARVALPAPLAPGRTLSESLYRSLSPVTRPRPGDLAFFHGTRRQDRAGRARGRFTHVALVEAANGPRVTLIHRGSHGIRRLAMNPERPHDRRENSVVRRGGADEGPRVPSLAGELFAGYASLRKPPASAHAEATAKRLRARGSSRHMR